MQEIYYIKTVDNSRWAPAGNPRERWHYGVPLLLFAVLLAFGLFAAHTRYESRENGYALERLERQKQELIEANRKLRLEEASLGDPLRIDWIARQQLGMTTLGPNQIFRGHDTVSGALVARAPSAVEVAASVPGRPATGNR